jgi:hypothetical protein
VQVGTECARGQLCTYMQGSPVQIQTPNIVAPDRQQHERSAACVIAQQYSSVTFPYFDFIPGRKIFGRI